MSKSAITVRDVFELPEPDAPKSENWKSFQEKVRKEVKGIKTAALPDMAEKVGQLFDIPIPNIFLTSWKKATGIQSLLAESRQDPEAVMNAELGDHTINSQHRPHIEIRIQNKAVKKIEFTLKLVFNLKGFVLKIQNGEIRAVQTGLCEVRGKMEYQGLVIAEKKLAPITLPGSVSFEETKSESEPERATEKPATLEENPVTLTEPGDEKDSEGAVAAGMTERISRETNRANDESLRLDSTKTEKGDQPSASLMLQELSAPEIFQATPAPDEHVKPVEQSVLGDVVAPVPDSDQVSQADEGAHSDVKVSDPEIDAAFEPEETPPDIASSQPENNTAAEHEAGQGITPEEASITPAQATQETVEEDERMTWEVGDDEEFAASEQAESSDRDAMSAGEEPHAAESAEDVISRMSRELAEKQQSTRATDETTDRAKTAS